MNEIKVTIYFSGKPMGLVWSIEPYDAINYEGQVEEILPKSYSITLEGEKIEQADGYKYVKNLPYFFRGAYWSAGNVQETTPDDAGLIRKQNPGLPPRPGLRWKPSTHRWIRPQEEVAGKSKTIKYEPKRFGRVKDPNLDSAVIILSVPEEIKKKLTFKDGTPPDDLHLTLIFMRFPKISWDIWVGKMEEAMSKVPWPDKIIGKIVKINRFENVQSQPGHDAIVAAIESPEIVQLRNQLADELEKVGISIDKTHKDYLPHITLMYTPHGEPSPIEELEQQEIEFDGLELWDASDKHQISLHRENE